MKKIFWQYAIAHVVGVTIGILVLIGTLTLCLFFQKALSPSYHEPPKVYTAEEVVVMVEQPMGFIEEQLRRHPSFSAYARRGNAHFFSEGLYTLEQVGEIKRYLMEPEALGERLRYVENHKKILRDR